jgi:hypothetical protein
MYNKDTAVSVDSANGSWPVPATPPLLAGSIVFMGAAGTNGPLLLLGVALLGAGFGNATSLPPLIAQIEFVKRDVPPVVALIVSIAQGAYAFAPAVLVW